MMSARTLQRRLEQAKATLVQLLDDTRREFAGQYLGRLHLSLGQAAYSRLCRPEQLLMRACWRWFKASAGPYCNQLLQGATATS